MTANTEEEMTNGDIVAFLACHCLIALEEGYWQRTTIAKYPMPNSVGTLVAFCDECNMVVEVGY